MLYNNYIIKNVKFRQGRKRNKPMPKPQPFKQDGKTSDTLFVGSLEKGFRVLEAFRKAKTPLGITEIAHLTGFDKSTAQRFSNTLHKLGYLEKDSGTRRYRPAIGLLDLSFTYLAQNHLAESAVSRLIDASKKFDTTVNLCEMTGTDIIYTLRIPHEKTNYMATIPGRRMPAYCTSSGTVMLAFMPEREAIDIVDRSTKTAITPHTITRRDAILERISMAREQGYGIGIQQSIMNEISVAAPVLDQTGRAIAAVQIPAYMPAWTEEDVRQKLAPLAMETARAISEPLNGPQ